ncbi:MAG: VanZ family protein [Treponemataceae bacterium]|nr:VanZ family protein [Treponemataceae bacterium]
MFEIKYWTAFAFIAAVWILIRLIINFTAKNFSLKNEAKMLLVFIGIVVIVRIVYFPWHHVNGKIGTLKFDSSKILPFWINFVPIIHMFDSYDGWLMNIIGNITMFIPIGIFWPLCFKELNSIGKSTLAGIGFTLFIETSQLLFYERCTDIDDLLMNTTGYIIGTLIYFAIKKICKIKND